MCGPPLANPPFFLHTATFDPAAGAGKRCGAVECAAGAAAAGDESVGGGDAPPRRCALAAAAGPAPGVAPQLAVRICDFSKKHRRARETFSESHTTHLLGELPLAAAAGRAPGLAQQLAMDGFGVNAWTRLLHDSPTLCMHRSWCLSAVHAASVSTGAAISGCEAVLCVHRRLSMTLLSTVLLGAVALYMVAMRLARGAPDYRQVQLESPSGEDALEAGTPEEEMPTAALLTQGSASPRFGQ